MCPVLSCYLQNFYTHRSHQTNDTVRDTLHSSDCQQIFLNSYPFTFIITLDETQSSQLKKISFSNSIFGNSMQLGTLIYLNFLKINLQIRC
jgi:hypothetical protein